MWIVRFDPKEREAWVQARVHGPLGFWDVTCLLDSGSSITIINTPILDALGYTAQMGKKRREMWTTAEPLPGYTLDVHLEALGPDLPTFEILAQDIAADQFGVEGLIGMDLVEGRVLTLNGKIGLVTLEA